MRWYSRGFVGFAALALLMGLLVAPGAVTAGTADANHNWISVLQSPNEVPPVDEGALGVCWFHAGDDGQSLDYSVYFWNITNPTMGHIHLGGKGVNGPVVVPLYTGTPKITGNYSGTIASGTITAKDLTGPLQGKTMDDLFAAMKSGNTYCNFHTTKNPGGAARGQITSDELRYIGSVLQ